MIALSYVSCDKQRFSQDELVELLHHCHQSNKRLDVTGLLVYNGQGTFLQVIEGEADVIDSLYEKIKKDKRHQRVTCIGRKTIEARGFPDWKMGFRNLNNEKSITLNGFSDFMENDKPADYLINHASFANSMLSYFKNASNELAF